MIRSGLLLGAGNVSAALLSLLRNVLIARLIGVEDFGIASTLAIAMSAVEATSYIALDRLLVQARDGEASAFMSTAHAILALRGVLGAGVLFLAAGPIAWLFGVPEVAWAYQALALTPLLRGFAHLDIHRRQRQMHFLPFVTVEATAQLVATAAALPLALAFGDYRVMLFCLLIQQLVFMAASHAVSTRPYRWAWDGAIVRRSIAFGWPVLLNSVLMLGMFYGDRVIVGSLLGMTELGWFSAALMLTMIPVQIVSGTLSGWFLPQLSRVQDDEVKFVRLYLVTTQACLLTGLLLAVGFALLGPGLFLMLYGAQYEAGLSVLVLMALMQGVRLARAGPSIVATSMARTTNPLLANVARVSMLPVAWVFVYTGAGVTSVVAVGIIAEVFALAVSLYLLRQKLGLPLGDLARPLAASLGLIVLLGFHEHVWRPSAPDVDGMFAVQAMVAVALVLAFWSMPALRHWGRAVLFAHRLPARGG